MRTLLLVAGIAAAALIPSLALAASTDGADTGYHGPDTGYQGDGRRDVDHREAWLEQRIQSATASGALSRSDSARDLDRLTSIRSREGEMRAATGQLAPQDESYLEQRLDRLSLALRASIPAGS